MSLMDGRSGCLHKNVGSLRNMIIVDEKHGYKSQSVLYGGIAADNEGYVISRTWISILQLFELRLLHGLNLSA